MTLEDIAMTILCRRAAAGAAALAATLLACLPAASAEAPVKGSHHFALMGHVPIIYSPPHGRDKGTIEKMALDLSAQDTEGLLTLQDEIWYPKFTVPLHYHEWHAEIFYVISGAAEWTIGGETHVVHAGELVYIPPNTPHKVHVVVGQPEHDLFISLPGGFEQQEYTAKQFSEQELSTPAAKAMLADLADFHPLPDDTVIPPDDAGPGPHRDVHHFALTGHVRVAHNPSGNVTSKIDLAGWQTDGRLTLQDEIWPADFNVELHYHKLHSEIFYVLGGAVEWTVGGETHVMHEGDLVYFPPDTPHKVHVVGGEPAHLLLIQLPGGYERAVDLGNEFPESERSQPAAKAAFDALHDFNDLPDPHPYRPGQ